MSRDSSRQELINEMEEIEECILFCVAMGEWKMMDDLLLAYYFMDCERKQHEDRFANLFPNLTTPLQFRRVFKVSREEWANVTAEIENHAVFNDKNNNNNNQVDPARQLAIALFCFAHRGNRSSVENVARHFGLETGTVTLFTKRVVTALTSIASEWIKWPDRDDREDMGLTMRKEGFPNCVGFITKTTFPLYQDGPRGSASSHLARNHRSWITLQIVCDVNARIIAFHLADPVSSEEVSTSDIDVFKRPRSYFSPGEYLLADSAYTLTTRCISPYKSSEAEVLDNAEFNACLSHSHSRVKHCIEMLKSKWCSLMELRQRQRPRQQTRNKNDVEFLLNWITACFVLHNMLAPASDNWPERSNSGSDGPEEHSTVSSPSQVAVNFRESLKKVTIETNRAKGRPGQL